MLRERPILFNGDSVRAILRGQKTQTRRVVKPQPHAGVRLDPTIPSGLTDGHGREIRLRYGTPGDNLWVRETWAMRSDAEPGSEKAKHHLHYKADGDELSGEWHDYHPGWRPSIFMPRWASRVLLEITEVRLERVQAISEEDAIAEGAPKMHLDGLGQTWATHKRGFESVWDSINAKHGFGWEENPWVWVIKFEQLTAGGGVG